MTSLLWRIPLTVLVGYLLGSLNGAILLSKRIFHDDIRSHGSGNAGMTNFMRTFGGPATLCVILIDLCKVFLGCWIGGLLLQNSGLGPEGQMLGGLAAVIGHSFPVYYDFHGGKGILSTGALAIFMDWRIFVVLFSLFLVVVIITKYVSLGSIIAAGLYPIAFAVVFRGHPWIVAMSLIGWFDIYRHRANIQRLLSGTESKFSIRHRED